MSRGGWRKDYEKQAHDEQEGRESSKQLPFKKYDGGKSTETLKKKSIQSLRTVVKNQDL